MSKAVVLFSGGIDSTVCLATEIRRRGAENVTALSLHYGQKHSKEMESARAVARHYGVELIEHDISQLFSFDKSSLLSGSGETLPTGAYTDEVPSTYVAFRNGLFLSAATSIAYSLGAFMVIYGAHADDRVGSAYPDCTPSFVKAMDKAVLEGTGGKVTIWAPLLHESKAAIVVAGHLAEVPYHLTWSCYEGEEEACGVCSTCVDRLEAFDKCGLVDPIPYRKTLLQ